ncbi:hypothetical protein CMK14_04670 [Candidatus Poribacteria bacterium]|nr:hypothetical protein [Candidatus Poribacteria bacterium]
MESSSNRLFNAPEWCIARALGIYFLGWFCKLIVLKIGGTGSYRRFGPLLLGLVLGESFIGGIWIVVGLFTGTGYRIWRS